MATRNILKEGERGLNKKSRKVTDFNARLHLLIDDMRETLIEANGLGLAASQVGVLRRVVLIVDTEADVEYIDDQIIELVNPQLIEQTGEQTGSEGCLSMPGVYGIVTRPDIVKITAQDRYGKTFELSASELTARAVCHELDHLDGVLFTSIADRLLSEEEIAEMNAQRYDDEESENPESLQQEEADRV